MLFFSLFAEVHITQRCRGSLPHKHNQWEWSSRSLLASFPLPGGGLIPTQTQREEVHCLICITGTRNHNMDQFWDLWPLFDPEIGSLGNSPIGQPSPWFNHYSCKKLKGIPALGLKVDLWINLRFSNLSRIDYTF